MNTGTTSKYITKSLKQQQIFAVLIFVLTESRVLIPLLYFIIQVKWFIDEQVAMSAGHTGPLKCWPHCPSIENGPFHGSTYSHRYYLIQLHFHWGCQGHDGCTDTYEDGTTGSEHTIESYS